MSIEIYTVLGVHSDGSRGPDVAKQYGSYRNIDDAYIKLRELVNKEWNPEEVYPRSRRGPRQRLTAREFLDLQEQMKQASAEAKRLKPIFHQLEESVSHIPVGENPEIDTRLDELAEKINTAVYEEVRLRDLLEEANSIFINKVGGKWTVVGGYTIERDRHTPYHAFFEGDIEASASLDEGMEGTRFFIIKTHLQ